MELPPTVKAKKKYSTSVGSKIRNHVKHSSWFHKQIAFFKPSISKSVHFYSFYVNTLHIVDCCWPTTC